VSPSSLATEQTNPHYVGTGEDGGISPSELRLAYNLPATGGAAQTVAIVDAYGDPNAESDLAVYRETYKLGECKKKNAKGEVTNCFRKVNQKGEEANYPGASASWSREISLDLDMISAVCPECHILLVEANNNENSVMGEADNEAAALGATEISDSWDEYESAFSKAEIEYGDSHYYNHPGIPITVAASEEGIVPEYPGSSPLVISVGATTLFQAASTPRGWGEEVWAPSGGGCSKEEPAPPWQKLNERASLCEGRLQNDVAAVGSDSSPVSVYDSFDRSGWETDAGTSVSTPIIAGAEAHASSSFRQEGPEAFYRSKLADVAFGDVTPGCISYLCHGESGYDAPTGWGAPYGVLELSNQRQAITGAAANTTETTATLQGYVNPAEAETTYRFEYGRTPEYGMDAPVPNAKVASSAVWQPVSQNVTGLAANAVYHFRIAATHGGVTTYGTDKMFSTAGIPAVETWPVSEVVETAAQLHGSVDPRGLSTSYYFEYGITKSYSKMTAETSAGSGTSPVEERAIVTELTHDTTYHFRVVATNSDGTAYGADETVTPAEKPTVETKLASDISESGATLIGSVDPSGAETSYYFEYGLEKEKYEHKTAEVSAGSGIANLEKSQAISGLRARTPYHFRIVATNRYGTVGGADEMFTTTIKPYVETKEATGASRVGATVEGVVNPEGLETKYYFEYGLITPYESKTTEMAVGAGTGNVEVSTAIAGLIPSRTYHFRIVAVSSGGTADGKDVVFTTTAFPPSYLSSFGSFGTGEGQFKHPGSVAMDSKGNLWVLDQEGDRVQKFNAKDEFVSQFGSKGTGEGQFELPAALTIDSKGNIWVADTWNNRVEEFNGEGKYVKKFGSWTGYGGQFGVVEGIAVNASGDVWISDASSRRLQEYSESGELLKTVGSEGSGPGQFGAPEGIAIGPSGNLFVADWTDDRVEEFNGAGEYVREFGVEGSGNGEFIHPDAVNVDAYGDVWVIDRGNSRVEEFNEGGEYLAQLGTEGSGAGQVQFSFPTGIATDPQGDVWVTDPGNHRVEEWNHER